MLRQRQAELEELVVRLRKEIAERDARAAAALAAQAAAAEAEEEEEAAEPEEAPSAAKQVGGHCRWTLTSKGACRASPTQQLPEGYRHPFMPATVIPRPLSCSLTSHSPPPVQATTPAPGQGLHNACSQFPTPPAPPVPSPGIATQFPSPLPASMAPPAPPPLQQQLYAQFPSPLPAPAAATAAAQHSPLPLQPPRDPGQSPLPQPSNHGA